MATTPTYSWPIPDDTDLVKDGAEAIRDLGNAIDTTVDGLGIGLVHIDTTTFSASSAESFNDVFSADYEHYKIIVSYNSSVGGSIYLRLRASGSDLSTSYYYGSLVNSTSATNFYQGGSNAAQILLIGNNAATNTMSVSVEIQNPFLTKRTGFNFSAIDPSLVRFATGGAFVDNTNSYTGFSLIPSAGTITGSVTLWGYKK